MSGQAAERSGVALAVWPCAQTTSQWQRHGRYVPDSNLHPAKMLPKLARRAIEAYSDPGDLVVDPMCGIGTTLVEAIHLDRRAVGVELESRWGKLATANVSLAQQQGATGEAVVLRGDARQLPRLLAKETPDLLLTSPPYGNAVLGDANDRDGIVRARTSEGRPVSDADSRRSRTARRRRRYGDAAASVAHLPYGRVDLVLGSPPYAAEVGHFNPKAWGTGRSLCQEDTRNYGPDHTNLGHARGDSYLASMAEIYGACAAILKPGGYLVLVTKNMRAGGRLRDLAGDTIALCQQTDLVYWQHVIALLATVRDGELFPRPSVWQRIHLRRALARHQRWHLVCHEDVLVFRKPGGAAQAARSATSTRKAA